MDISIIDEHLKDFYIPSYIIIPGSKVEHDSSEPPTCPVIVFINTKSGGQLGGELLRTYKSILNPNQVFDLGKTAPEKVLSQVYNNLEKLKHGKDSFAPEIQKRLRIIVAGGDGTAGWILGVVYDLKLPHSPPVATVPLGTGNNLPFSFGWGKKNPGTDRQSVETFLEQVKTAREMNVDSWHIHMNMKAPKEAHMDPIPILELPNSLHAIHRVTENDATEREKYLSFQGGFWNYFSMGMDAQVSYAFHSERKLHPEKFKSQMGNQSAYLKLGFSQGWFCPSLRHPSAGNIGRLAKVNVMARDGEWEELRIPKSIRSILCLNLPSFSGGLNPWGTPATKKSHDRGLAPPYVDDGLLEIVGFKDAWHGLVLLTPGGHGTRLAQAHAIKLEFHKGAAEHTYMRIDGEPWKQPLPLDSDKVVIEISHLGQVKMLARPMCRSKSVVHRDEFDEWNVSSSSSTSGSGSENGRRVRKIGAAESFKFADEIEIER